MPNDYLFFAKQKSFPRPYTSSIRHSSHSPVAVLPSRKKWTTALRLQVHFGTIKLKSFNYCSFGVVCTLLN